MGQLEIFQKLDKEKQDRVLNAAFTCFAKNGYKKASIADIANEAGISKTSVFHYFGSKKDLYLFLLDFSAKILGQAVSTYDFRSDDFFVRIAEIQKMKNSVASKYENLYNFVYSIRHEQDTEIITALSKEKKAYTQFGFELLFNGVNWDKFKPGIDRQFVINMMVWVSDGHAKSASAEKKSLEVMSSEVEQYLSLLKNSFYKEEYLSE